MTEDTLGIGTVQRQTGEELRGHAPAAASVVCRAGPTRSAALWPSQLSEQLRVSPHGREAAWLAQVAGEKRPMDRERTGIDVADRVDEAHDATRAAQV